ncbi:unnamed protein product [Protopolystoma xenopodis]|uniref:Uncharacterized protein n=1 Tax=Protopolystoma xenopodis TaxID=117903 RepID=A0A448WEW7_9PLAT|nr:unnamed protein product [Protopolystoma xenopodis]
MPSAPQVSSEDLRSTAQPKHVVPANDKPSKTPIASCCWSIRSGLTDYLRTLRVGAGARKQLGITEKALMMTKFRRCLSTMDLVCYGIGK